MGVSLSVIMPALNEAQNIEAALRGVFQALEVSSISNAEVLVMTCLDRNGTRDETVEIVQRLSEAEPRIRLVHVDAYQKLGEKFRTAVQLASKEYCVMVPGDNENDSTSLPVIFGEIGKADMVVSYTSNPEVRSLYRQFLSRTYTLALNVLFWHGLPYYNGINVYRKEDLLTALPTTDSFAYSAEILITLLRSQQTYVVVPIRIQARPGTSKALRWQNFKSVIAAVMRLWGRMTFRRT